MNINTDTYRARYRPDQWKPEIETREIKMVKIGSWFFGLLGHYKMVYTKWRCEK